MAEGHKPNLIVTNIDGSVGKPEENKVKLKKTKPAEESPNYLNTPKKVKKQQQKKAPQEVNDPRNLSADQIDEMQEAFNFFDRDQSGTISAKEIANVMRSLGQNPTESEISDIVHEMDADGNGEIDFDEFVTMMSTRMKSTDEMTDELHTAFNLFDLDGNGRISVDELRTVMANLGEKLSNEEAQAIFDLWDLNKDGVIDYMEFTIAMSSGSVFR